MDFFSTLRTKLLKKPDRNFDQRFWNRFDQEFSQKKLFLFSSRINIWVPLAVSLGLLFVFISRSPRLNQEKIEVTQEFDFFNDVEFFGEMDEALLSATDEEWDKLLESGTS